MAGKALVIDYYSDILCVWAWIAQRRIDELHRQLGDQISIRHHYINLFGDTATRMQSTWADKGLYDGFALHVEEALAPFEEAKVHADVWRKVRPPTSANAHLIIKAVQLAYGVCEAEKIALKLRQAFFIEAKDVADLAVLFELVSSAGLELPAVQQAVNSGEAMALLMGDYQQQKTLGIKGSPSYVMNNGRQTLYGNVGYRVLRANVEELLKNAGDDEASWC